MIARAVPVSFALALALAGCAHPYSGKPEPLERPPPREKAAGDEGDDGKDSESCRTNFFAEPHTGERADDEARQMAKLSDPILLRAERAEGAERERAVSEAMEQIRTALTKDPYGPEPTYKLAVAYALTDHKACALRLLERLAELQKMPKVAPEARRVTRRAQHDIAFDAFRDEADTALQPK